MAHENLHREQVVESSSDRAFGFVFAVVFLIIAAWPLVVRSGSPRWWSVGLAAAFALVAQFHPSLLAGLNRQWTRLGLLLGRIVSPIALGLLFYLVLTPTGALMRAFGKDPMSLRRDRAAATYWRPRQPPGPPPDSMHQQF